MLGAVVCAEVTDAKPATHHEHLGINGEHEVEHGVQRRQESPDSEDEAAHVNVEAEEI